jgi:hypothetical protein
MMPIAPSVRIRLKVVGVRRVFWVFMRIRFQLALLRVRRWTKKALGL